MSRFFRVAAVALLALVIAGPALGGQTARAHTFLLWSDPAADAVLTASPEWVTLGFDVNPARGTTIAVLDEWGNDLAAGPTVRDGEKAGVPVWPLGPGIYTVTYTVVSSDDGHETAGSFLFTIVPAQ